MRSAAQFGEKTMGRGLQSVEVQHDVIGLLITC